VSTFGKEGEGEGDEEGDLLISFPLTLPIPFEIDARNWRSERKKKEREMGRAIV
jgi:hypothetical protein